MSVFYRSIASDIGSISEPLLNLLPTFVNEEPIFIYLFPQKTVTIKTI